MCLIPIVSAATETDVEDNVSTKYSPALQRLYVAMQAGPHEIETTAPTGELRGWGFEGFDGLLYKFFEKREFVTEQPYALLEYACGTGRWSANAVLQAEMDGVSLNVKTFDPFMQPEHAEYYNQAWSRYVLDNGSSHGSLLVSQGWLKDAQLAATDKFNGMLVRDAIHLFSDEQVVELFQLGAALTDENGSIVVRGTPPFATMLWSPKVQIFLITQGLTPPNFGEILFNESNYKAYTEMAAQNIPGVIGQMNTKSVCLPAIRNAAEANGWWLQAIQVGTTVMTHKKPLTEEELYTFVSTQVQKYKPKPEEFNLDYVPEDPGIILRFKKTPSARPTETE
jgi:hypothetical protein